MLEKIEKIREAVLTASNYSKNKSDKFGEVFTPFFLIDEMLDLVKPEDWSNPEVTFYDPCVGKGNFPIQIISRLFEGLTNVIPDPSKRLDHILTKQLFMCEFQNESYEDTKTILSTLGSPLNFIHGDALTVTSRSFGLDNFNYTIANPPYQSTNTRRRIFDKFIKHTHPFSSNQIYVIPSSWVYNKYLKSYFEDNNLSNVTFFPPSVFGFELRFSISVVKFESTISDRIEICKDKQCYYINRGSHILDCNSHQYELLNFASELPSLHFELGKNPPPRGLNKKITQERLPKNFSTIPTETHKYRTALYTSVSKNPSFYVYTDEHEISYDNITVNLPLIVSKYSLGNVIILPEGIQSLDNQYFTKASSMKEAEAILEYLNSDVIRYIVKLTKVNDIMTTKANSLNFIPKLEYREILERKYSNLFI